MAVSIKAIKPKTPLIDKARLVLLNEMRSIGKDIVDDFEKTTATWTKKPTFNLKISLAGRQPNVTISTTNDIYRYVDEGTRPHVIAPVNAKILRFPGTFTAKTTPGVIGSGSGRSGGGNVFARIVHHPGTRARGFTPKIARKWRGEFGKRMKRAMTEAAKATGHGR